MEWDHLKGDRLDGPDASVRPRIHWRFVSNARAFEPRGRAIVSSAPWRSMLLLTETQRRGASPALKRRSHSHTEVAKGKPAHSPITSRAGDRS
jgi:hypothetical protein